MCGLWMWGTCSHLTQLQVRDGFRWVSLFPSISFGWSKTEVRFQPVWLFLEMWFVFPNHLSSDQLCIALSSPVDHLMRACAITNGRLSAVFWQYREAFGVGFPGALVGAMAAYAGFGHPLIREARLNIALPDWLAGDTTNLSVGAYLQSAGMLINPNGTTAASSANTSGIQSFSVGLLAMTAADKVASGHLANASMNSHGRNLKLFLIRNSPIPMQQQQAGTSILKTRGRQWQRQQHLVYIGDYTTYNLQWL